MEKNFTINLGEREVGIVMNALLALQDLQKEEYKAECNRLYDEIKAQALQQK